MIWFDRYTKSIVSYDLLLRDPILFNQKGVKNIVLDNIGGQMIVSTGKFKEYASSLVITNSILNDFSNNSKVSVLQERSKTGKKVLRFLVKLNKNSSIFFIDFFLNMVLKGLKRRYISLSYSINETGILNFSFSNLSELDLDDFFFFESLDLSSKLNILFNFYSDKDIILNKIFSNYFINIFKFSLYTKYEVSNRKG